MKAILRAGAGLLGLLLLASASHGYYWVSPVLKQPYPVAPSPSNSAGIYLMNAYGQWSGPHYYLVPPYQPFNGILPGQIGQAIMSGNLPPDLLKSKEAMSLGNVPLLRGKKGQGGQEGQGQEPRFAPMQGMAPMPNPMPSFAPMPNPMPNFAPMPYPMPGGGNMMPSPHMQVPYTNLPRTPYALQPPYVPPMPMPQPMMQPMGYGPGAPMMQPIGYVPYYGPPGMYATAQRDPRTGVWQVQNVMPGQGPSPFMPIPGFGPGQPGMPMQNGPPMFMPPTAPIPGVNMPPFNGMQPFSPMQPLTPLNPLQGPIPPRMDMMPPPPRPAPGYPTHPFTRSPRDFFMWGEAMEDERARGSRPFPVP